MRFVLSAVMLSLALGLTAPAGAANPYAQVASVNGMLITEHDVIQRSRLMQALGAGPTPRPEVIDELTEDRLRVHEGAALGVRVPPAAIEAGIAEFAEARGMSADEMIALLKERGVDRQAIEDFVESNLIWREIVGTRFRDRALPSEEEVDRALSAFRIASVKVYRLAEIVLPDGERGREETLAFARQLADDITLGADFAAAARAYSQSPTAPGGGVMPPIAAQALPPRVRAEVSRLSVDDVSRPVGIEGAVVIVKLLGSRYEQPPRDPNETEEDRRDFIRRQLFSEKITGFGDGYMQELRAAAIIERK